MNRLFYILLYLKIVMLLFWMSCSSTNNIPIITEQPKPTPYENGLALLEQGKYLQAETEFKAALRAAPLKPEILVKLGETYLQLQRLDAAKNSFDKALLIDPNRVEAIVGKAMVAYQAKNLTGALHLLEQALEINANHVDAHYKLGLVYKASNNLKYAIDEWQKVLAWQPDHIEAQRELKAAYASQEIAPQNTEYQQLVNAPSIKRGEMAWILVKEFQIQAESTPTLLKDIRNHWVKQEIERVVQSKIMSIQPENRFEPDALITRKNLAQIAQNLRIWRTRDDTMANMFIGMASPFNDVRSDDAAFNAIMLVTTLGIMEGYFDQSFKPGLNPSGQEVFEFIKNLKDTMK
ncbi:tetratricopeptide repeat protein [candidate division KSB1 bacterium]|nr:tetratricopeptide repeat protein [candidate division KSB1 bacterium]